MATLSEESETESTTEDKSTSDANNTNGKDKISSDNITASSDPGLIIANEKEDINLPNSHILCELSQILNKLLTKENSSIRDYYDTLSLNEMFSNALGSKTSSESSLLSSELCLDEQKERRHSVQSRSDYLYNKQCTDYFVTYLHDCNWSLSLSDYEKLLQQERNLLMCDNVSQDQPPKNGTDLQLQNDHWPPALVVSTILYSFIITLDITYFSDTRYYINSISFVAMKQV